MMLRFILLIIGIFACLISSNQAFGTKYFQNAGFETGDFSFWEYGGIASVIQGDGYVPAPHEGNYMALISLPGSPPDYAEGGFRNENYIKQDIDAFDGSISLWYNFFTTDYDYDNPGLLITVDGAPVFSLNANDMNLVEFADPVYSSGWQEFSWDLSGYSGSVELAIFAGNTDYNDFNSWVYVDDISPKAPPASPVPEPTTALLLCSGLGVLVLKRLRGAMY